MNRLTLVFLKEIINRFMIFFKNRFRSNCVNASSQNKPNQFRRTTTEENCRRNDIRINDNSHDRFLRRTTLTASEISDSSIPTSAAHVRACCKTRSKFDTFGMRIGFSKILSLSEKTTNTVPAASDRLLRSFCGKTICPFEDNAVVIGIKQILSVRFSYSILLKPGTSRQGGWYSVSLRGGIWNW